MLDSIKAAVDQENWLAGLALALMLPDICANVEKPLKRAPKRGELGKRYADWWDQNFGANYEYAPSDRIKGEEMWQLRCAYLHEGRELQARKPEISATIEKFKFAISGQHLVKNGSSVLLDVRKFCLDMCSRVEEWEKNTVSKDPSMQTTAEELLKIYVFVEVTGPVRFKAAANPRLSPPATE